MLFLFAENRGHPLDPGMISAELGDDALQLAALMVSIKFVHFQSKVYELQPKFSLMESSIRVFFGGEIELRLGKR